MADQARVARSLTRGGAGICRFWGEIFRGPANRPGRTLFDTGSGPPQSTAGRQPIGAASRLDQVEGLVVSRSLTEPGGPTGPRSSSSRRFLPPSRARHSSTCPGAAAEETRPRVEEVLAHRRRLGQDLGLRRELSLRRLFGACQDQPRPLAHEEAGAQIEDSSARGDCGVSWEGPGG